MFADLQLLTLGWLEEWACSTHTHMASYLMCWGGGALEDRYLYASPYPAVYR